MVLSLSKATVWNDNPKSPREAYFLFKMPWKAGNAPPGQTPMLRGASPDEGDRQTPAPGLSFLAQMGKAEINTVWSKKEVLVPEAVTAHQREKIKKKHQA